MVDGETGNSVGGVLVSVQMEADQIAFQGRTDFRGFLKLPGLATLQGPQGGHGRPRLLLTAQKSKRFGYVWVPEPPGGRPKNITTPATLWIPKAVWVPGQSVELWGRLPGPPVGKPKLTVKGPRGEIFWSGAPPVIARDQIRTTLKLPSWTLPGSYRVTLTGSVRQRGDIRQAQAQTSFRVESEEQPLLSLDIESQDALRPSTTVKATFQATHPNGVPFSDVQVSFQAAARAQQNTPKLFKNHNFTGNNAPEENLYTLVFSETRQVQTRGKAIFEFPLEDNNFRNGGQLELTATLLDAGGKTLAVTRRTMPVRGAPHRIGVNTSTKLVAPGTSATGTAVLLDENELPLPTPLSMEVRYFGPWGDLGCKSPPCPPLKITNRVLEVVPTGIQPFDVTLDRPGRYELSFQEPPGPGQETSPSLPTTFEVWATGPELASEQRDIQAASLSEPTGAVHREVQLVADKPVYRPGDTAQLLVVSPLAWTHALVLTEGTDGLKRLADTAIAPGTRILTLPIRKMPLQVSG